MGACAPLELFLFCSEGNGKGSEPKNDSQTGFNGITPANRKRLLGVGKAGTRDELGGQCSNPGGWRW